MSIHTPQRAGSAISRVLHPAFLAGFLLTGVGIAFNVSHGYHLGGSDALRAFGMAGVFLAAIVLKDSLLGQLVLAFRARRFGLAFACLVGFSLGATGSMIAAFGSASEGREEKSDPRQAQITAYDTAEKIVKDADARLAELGRTSTAAEAKADVARLLAAMDAGIAKRTSACTVLEPQGTGKRQIAVNREACQPVIEAQAKIAAADEAQRLRDKRDAARETVAKGKPKAADPLVANLTALWSRVSGSTGDLDFGAVLSLLVALIVELGAPVSWAIWQMAGPTKPDTASEEAGSDAGLEALRASFSAPLPDTAGPTVAQVIRLPLGPNRRTGPDSGGPAPDRPKRPSPGPIGLSKAQAFDDLMQRLSDGRTIGSQDELAADWQRPKQTVSDWMREWRKMGAVPQAIRAGRCKVTAGQ